MPKFDLKNLSVGQTVYRIVKIQKSTTVIGVPITRIGRKWVYFNGNNQDRFDCCGDIDGYGYSSPGIVYLTSEEAYEKINGDKLWQELYRFAQHSYNKPHNLSAEQLMLAKRALNDFER